MVLAITSAKQQIMAKQTLAITSAKHSKQKCPKQNWRTHQYYDTSKCWKWLRLTFSSDLKEAMLDSGESLSTIKLKFCFWESHLVYIKSNRMRNIHAKKIVENKPGLGQGRAGIRCKKPEPVDGITASKSKSCKIPKIPMTQDVAKNRMDFPVWEQSITSKTKAIMRGMAQDKNRELPFHPDLIYRPPPRPPENLWPESPESKPDIRPKIDIKFEENSLYHEGIISKAYQRPDKSYFQEPKELESLVNTGRLVQKFLPK